MWLVLLIMVFGFGTLAEAGVIGFSLNDVESLDPTTCTMCTPEEDDSPATDDLPETPMPQPGVECGNSPADPYPNYQFCGSWGNPSIPDEPIVQPPAPPDPIPGPIPTPGGGGGGGGGNPNPTPMPDPNPGPTPMPGPFPDPMPMPEMPDYLGCVDIDGKPEETRECKPEKRDCLLPQSYVFTYNKCEKQGNECVLVPGQRTYDAGLICLFGTPICTHSMWERTGTNCQEKGCKYFDWSRDQTNSCWTKIWSLSCSEPDGLTNHRVDCDPDDINPPKDPGQHGGVFVPDPSCYDDTTGECGLGTCNFFVTHDKDKDCAEVDNPTEVPGSQSTCGKVKDPTLQILDETYDRLECFDDEDDDGNPLPFPIPPG